MIERLRVWLRWIGAVLIAWGTPSMPADPYDFVSLTESEADALLALFSRPSDPGACATCGAAWLEHRCPFTVSSSQRRCEVCGVPLAVDTVRTHEGKWLCRAHK